MPIVNLTQNFVSNELTCPPDKSRIEWCDGGSSSVPGLYVLVSAAGKIASFFLRYKDASGKTCHQKIGRTTDISLADARIKAKALKAEITLGANPRAQAKAQKEVLAFSDFFEKHYLPYVKSRKRSWKRDDELYKLRIKKVFGDKRLNQITRQQIQSFHTDLLATGLAPATCDHHIKLIKHAFNLAIDWGLFAEKNPGARIPLYGVDNRIENIPDDAELERLLGVLRTDENRAVCLIAMYLMTTGCRLNEALQAKWNQIDKQNRVWRIPASNSKSKRIRSVPLNDSSMEIINALPTQGAFEYLFINQKTKRPYTTIMKVWSRLRKKAGLTLRLHDLRHFHASRLVCSGVPIYEVKAILGHANIVTTERYSHLSNKRLADASKNIDVALKGATPVPASGELA